MHHRFGERERAAAESAIFVQSLELVAVKARKAVLMASDAAQSVRKFVERLVHELDISDFVVKDIRGDSESVMSDTGVVMRNNGAVDAGHLIEVQCEEANASSSEDIDIFSSDIDEIVNIKKEPELAQIIAGFCRSDVSMWEDDRFLEQFLFTDQCGALK